MEHFIAEMSRSSITTSLYVAHSQVVSWCHVSWREFTALRSIFASLAFARPWPFEPGMRRDICLAALRRSDIVALSGRGLGSSIAAPDQGRWATPVRIRLQ